MENQKKEKVIPVPDYTLPPLPFIEKTGSVKGHSGVTFVAGEGIKPADIMFITSCVSPQEASKFIRGRDGQEGVRVQPRYLRSDAGVIFTDIFNQEGIDLYKCYYTALIKWLLPKNERAKVPKDIIAWALPSLDAEIQAVGPKIIVCIGKPIFDLLADIKLSLSDAKSGWFFNEKYNAKLYLIDDTYKLVTNPEYIEKFRVEAKEIKRMHDEVCNVNTHRVPLEYETITNSADLKRVVSNWKHNNFNVISVDCEWAGNNHIDGKLRSTQFCWAPGKACYVRWMDDKGNYVFDITYKEAGKILAEWLDREDVKYIGHHFAADAPWLHHVLGLNWYEKCIFDTEFAQQTANEAEDLSLERIAMKYTDLGRYDLELVLWVKHNKALMEDGGYGAIPDEILIPYACLRQESLVQLGDGSWRKIKDLVNQKYSGEVRAFLDGKVQNCKVTNWYKTNTRQKDWRKLVTKYAQKGKHGYLGPVLTPDHKVLTQRGKVAVQDLVPGSDSILTTYNTFSDMQLSIFLGCLLGDGGIAQRNSAHAGVVLSQCLRRSEYLKWKVKVLFGDTENVTLCKSRATYCSAYSPYIAHLSDIWLRKTSEDHCRRKLIITEDVLNQLKAPGLAVWYQDDGNLTSDGEVRITIYHLYDEELSTLKSWFAKTLGIKVKYRRDQNHICFSVEDSAKFLNYIRHYVHPSCSYKTYLPCDLKLDYYEPGPLYLEPIDDIINVASKPCSGDGIRYCLSVDKAENFLTKSGFVSNCKDVDTVFRAWPFIHRSLQAQDLVDYYNNVFHPFVTDVFVSFALVGLPMDVETMDELRVLYTFARDKMEAILREDIHAEAKNFVLMAFATRMNPEIATNSYLEFISLIANSEHGQAWNVLKSAAKKPDDVPKLKSIFDHYIDSANFNIRSAAHLKRWLFHVKGYEPIKSTSNKEKGLPATSWEKIKSMPPEAQKNYNPAVDKQTLQILSEKNNDRILRKLLQLNAVGNICKAFLKEAEVDADGNVVKENGLHFYLCSDNRVHGQMSTTETGRPRSWKPNSLNWPSYVNSMIGNGIADLFGKLKERGELPAEFEKFIVKDEKGEYKSKVPSIRSCVKAPEGWCFVESDYQTAEIRGLAFISGDKSLIDIVCNPDLNFAVTKDDKKVRLSFPAEVFPPSVQEEYKHLLVSPDDPSLIRKDDGSLKHPKQDLHWSLAEMVHIKPREVLDEKKDRGAAKVGNFSCVNKYTKIRTEKGVLSIEDALISGCTYVWDGIAMVPYDSIQYQGNRFTINYQGLAATPDHVVWLSSGEKCCFGEAALRGLSIKSYSGVELDAAGSRHKNNRTHKKRHSIYGAVSKVSKNNAQVVAQRGVRQRPKVSLPVSFTIQRPTRAHARRKVSSHASKVSSRQPCQQLQLQGARHKINIQKSQRIYFMGASKMAGYRLQRFGLRQNKQRRSLFEGQPAFGYKARKSKKYESFSLVIPRTCREVVKRQPRCERSYANVMGHASNGVYRKRYIRENKVWGNTKSEGNTSKCESITSQKFATTKPRSEYRREANIEIISERLNRSGYNSPCGEAQKANFAYSAGKAARRKRFAACSASRYRLRGQHYKKADTCRTIRQTAISRLGKVVRKDRINQSEDREAWLKTQRLYYSQVDETGNVGYAVRRLFEEKGFKLTKEPVYDIINAGPRHRFIANGLLISNSAYGASASTLERKIEQDTGKKPEEGTGQRLLKALEKRQPVAQDFLIKMERIPEKPGYYRAASGRIRHFSSHDPKYLDDIDEHLTMGLFKSMGREARNFPMQESVAATAARAGKWLLDTYIKLNMQARPLIILYDSVVTLCPLEERFKVAQLHQLFMTDLNTWEYHGRKMNYPIDQLFCYRWSVKPSKDESKLLEDTKWKTGNSGGKS